MQVDRSRFLLLTASIAAAACSSGAAAPPPQSGPIGVSLDVPAAPASSAATDFATESSSADAPAGSAGEAAAPAEDAHHGIAADPFERVDQLIGELARSRGKCVYPAPPTPPMAPPMEEKPKPLVGPAHRCAKLREPPGPSCEDFALVETDCMEAVSALESAAAGRAMRCLERSSGTRALCGDRRIVGRCVDEAMKAVRIDPATASVCDQIARICSTAADLPAKALSTEECQRYLSSLRCWRLAEASGCLAGICSVELCIQPEY